MKRINIIITILIGLLCVAGQCSKENCHKTIEFVNNSSIEVYISSGWYSDTLGFCSLFPNPYNQPNLYRVKPGEKNSSGLASRSCLDGTVSRGNTFVYVFDAEVLANYTWGVIGRDYMVLKTYRPTLEEMESNDWTIYFTGE